MPGETIEDALQAATTLQPQRITTILTRLGENLTKLDEAEEVTAALPRRARPREARPGLDAQISVKPTQLGLDLDAAQSASATSIASCEKAEQAGNIPVWIDMENSPYVDPTLEAVSGQPREIATGVGHRDAGVPLSHRQGHRRPRSRSARPFASSRARISSRRMWRIRRSRTWTRTSTRCACG